MKKQFCRLSLILAGALACLGCGSESEAPTGQDVLDTQGGEDVGSTVPDVPAVDVDAGGCTTDADCPGRVALRNCEVASCDVATGRCVPAVAPDGTECDDGDPCTRPDTCLAGACQGQEWCECRDDPYCYRQYDDGNTCNGYHFCDKSQLPWACQPKAGTEIQCPPVGNDPCRANLCQPDSGRCELTPVNVGQACEDYNVCTQNTVCTAEGLCVGDETCQCETDDDCFQFENGNACDGSLFCDRTEFPYVCRVQPGSEIVCPAANDTPCRRNTCQPASGLCLMQASPDSTSCDDNNPCTVDDTCMAGVCEPGGFDSCDDGNPCTNDGCNPISGCQHAPNASPCPEVNLCHTGNVCRDGLCRLGPSVNCSDGIDCTSDSCIVTEGCRHLPSDTLCDDGDPCTLDSCDPESGCLHEFDPIACPLPDVVEPVPDVTEPEPDVAPPDTYPDVAPPDTYPDVAPDAYPDVAPPDAYPDVAPDAYPDVAPPDAYPDVAPDAYPDVAPDAVPADADSIDPFDLPPAEDLPRSQR